MLIFVLRCSRVPIRAGKIVRHAMRHHWGLSHHAAGHVYHAGVGSMLVCVAVPLLLPIVRDVARGANTPVPPFETGQAVAVPEPSSILLLAGGMVVMLLARRLRPANTTMAIAAAINGARIAMQGIRLGRRAPVARPKRSLPAN